MEIGPAEDASHLLVYRYSHLDDLSFAKSPSEVFEDSSFGTVSAYVDAVGKRFKSAGWEGDGTIRVIWLPPFVDVGIEDTWGTYVWHVKQSNDGISWIASHATLGFKRLLAQNEPWLDDTHILAGVMYTQCMGFGRRIRQLISELALQLAALQQPSEPVFAKIKNELLVAAQGELTAQLIYFLDDSYLEVLMEVLMHGNQSKLRLRKFRANLEPQSYLPSEEIGLSDDTDTSDWFTIHGIIGDIWRTYKFEPFAEKVKMLFGASDFIADPSLSAKFKKHILLRNCIQHDERRVTPEVLKQAGVANFKMLQDDGSTAEINAWEPISFSLMELRDFAKSLIQLASSFYEHTYKRIRRKDWVPRPSKA